MRAEQILPQGRHPADLVKLAWELTEVAVKKANALSKAPYTDDSRKDGKLTLGFLNSTIKAFNQSMVMFRISNLPQRVAEIKKLMKKRKF